MTHLTMLVRQWDYWWAVFRRTWRGTVISAVGSPLLYMAAMGVFLGSYIDERGGVGDGTYVDYILPGLLASTTMQIAMGETMWPVLGAIKWDKTYLGMVSTPLRVVDIVMGHLWSVVLRCVLAGAIFLSAMALMGGVAAGLGGVLAALVVQALVAFAFAAPCYALATRVERDSAFSVVMRVVITPLFLFSGAFFPLSNLPGPLQVVAKASPLYHAVELTRGLLHGTGSLGVHLASAAYLLALTAVGVRLCVVGLNGRLLS